MVWQISESLFLPSPRLGRCRIAPTPSGFLHAGNLVNFVISSRVAQDLNLELHLRIDDADAARVRPAYVDDIFRVCEWLGLHFSSGPRTKVQYQSSSQMHRTQIYWDFLQHMALDNADFFVCTCSRIMLEHGRCANNCATLISNFDAQSGTQSVRYRASHEDVTVWSKYFPSYHLVNVVEDYLARITHVVRGEDLLPSTHIHQDLAKIIYTQTNEVRPSIQYVHHALLTNANGSKLSKSQGTEMLELTASLKDYVIDVAEGMMPDILTQLNPRNT